MTDVEIRRAVQHCLLYPGLPCFGYITEKRVVPVSHAPLLPPFSEIIYTDISEMGVTAMYVADNSGLLPKSFSSFAAQKGIAIIYVVSLYNPEKRIQKFSLKEKNWKSETLTVDLTNTVADKGMIEYEAIFEGSK
ncbi:hypothetical protein EIN_391540 [Entamoeba invadens IP1]|uniref:Uncharacterized protein n=1 Tax=Entamoeba invadens IP1 TaxID=370355 RepID=A0A0A1U5C7_ENTIV|nr:hypothetical protein EIN_391540 [Entamoeba invadens IP1]ELP89499.1 hypothetical protein EIN_391540 [Entamoeba invadens IP1]|eukprot:XP_004256270.1 hypothetical protein EIN_391540 [Entamoeba invadens IP1]